MTPSRPVLDAWKSEEQRQSQFFAERLNTALMEAGKEFEVPILNSVAGAIVTLQASILASVADPRQRKMLRREMERQLPIALALQLARPQSHCEVVFVGGPQQ